MARAAEFRVRADSARMAGGTELDKWGAVQTLPPAQDVGDTRRVPDRKELDGVRTGQARLVAKRFQDPVLGDSSVDFAGRVSGSRSVCN